MTRAAARVLDVQLRTRKSCFDSSTVLGPSGAAAAQEQQEKQQQQQEKQQQQQQQQQPQQQPLIGQSGWLVLSV